jgi:hypothetical protein
LKATQSEIRRLRAIVGDRAPALDPDLHALLTLYWGPRDKSGDEQHPGSGGGYKAIWPIVCCARFPHEHVGDFEYWTRYAADHPPDCGEKSRISWLFWKWRRDADWFSPRMRAWQIKMGFRRRDGTWVS